MNIDNVKIAASGFNPCRDELAEYVRYVKARVPNVTNILVTLDDDDFVTLLYIAKAEKFERIRRITGFAN